MLYVLSKLKWFDYIIRMDTYRAQKKIVKAKALNTKEDNTKEVYNTCIKLNRFNKLF